jgi:hypothetical protein
MPLLTLGAKLWCLSAAIVGMILDVVQFWNHVCGVIILVLLAFLYTNISGYRDGCYG